MDLEQAKTAAATHVENMSYNGDSNVYYEEAAAARGAVLLEEEKHLGVWHSAKLHWRALLICKSSPVLYLTMLTEVDRQRLIHSRSRFWLRYHCQRCQYQHACKDSLHRR